MKYDFDIYTDGSCSNNPGPGAYSFIVLKSGELFYKSSCGFLMTTNNRMELLGVIEALLYIKNNCESNLVNVFSDSKYVTDAFNKEWIDNWRRKNFKGVLNVEYDKYQKISQRVHDLYDNYTTKEPHETNAMNKMMTWSGIEMKTMNDM